MRADSTPRLGKLLLLAVMLAPAVLAGQTPATGETSAGAAPILKYRNGSIQAQWIPYGRRWWIEGPTLTSRGKANVVTGTITPASGRNPPPAAAEDRSSVSCWWGGAAAGDTFRLAFPRQRIGDKLDVRLDFYQALASSQLEPAVRRAMQRAEEVVKDERGINNAELSAIFTEEAQGQLRAMGGGTVVVIKVLQEGQCGVSQQLPEVSLSATHVRAIQRVILARQAGVDADDALAPVEARLRNLDNEPGFADLVRTLREVAGSKIPLGITSADVDAFVEAVDLSSAPAPPVVRRLSSVDRECTSGGGRGRISGCGLLHEAVELFHAHHRHSTTIEGSAATIAANEGTIGIEVKNAFSSIAFALVPGVAWEDAPATSERLRFGTALGVGAAFLGSDLQPEEAATFGAASLKFYLYPVDKRLPDPYFGRPIASRWSLVIGAVRGGGIRYRGQEQEKVAGSLYPLLGAGFDLTRDITLQGGALFFRQPIPAGVSTPARSSPEGALFVSLGLDLDLGNRISDLLGIALK